MARSIASSISGHLTLFCALTSVLLSADSQEAISNILANESTVTNPCDDDKIDSKKRIRPNNTDHLGHSLQLGHWSSISDYSPEKRNDPFQFYQETEDGREILYFGFVQPFHIASQTTGDIFKHLFKQQGNMTNAEWDEFVTKQILNKPKVIQKFEGDRSKLTTWKGTYFGGAIAIAIEELNKNHESDYFFDFLWCDPGEDILLSARCVERLIQAGVVAIVGSGRKTCSHEAMIASVHLVPMISYSCNDEAVSDKKIYPTFARTIPALTEISKNLVSTLIEFKWRKVVIIHQSISAHITEKIQNLAKSHQITIQNISTVSYPFGQTNEKEIEQIVKETKDTTRVYVIFASPGNFLAYQALVLKIGDMGLLVKREYQIIVLVPEYEGYGHSEVYASMNNDFYRSGKEGADGFWDPKSTVEDPRRIIKYSKSVLAIIPTRSNVGKFHKDFNPKLQAYSGSKPFDIVRKEDVSINSRKKVPKPAAYLYDAVMMYGRALSITLAKNQSIYNGTKIIQKILGEKYESVQGFEMRLNEKGDAVGNYTLLSMLTFPPNDNISDPQYFPTDQALIPTAFFSLSDDNDTLPAIQFLDGKSIDWPTENKKPPLDEPACGFYNEKCHPEDDHMPEITAGILAATVLLIGFIAFFVYRNRKYERELAGLIWRIDPKEIQFHTIQASQLTLMDSKSSLVAKEPKSDKDPLLRTKESRGLGLYRGAIVAVKVYRYQKKSPDISRACRVEMKNMRGLHHDNICAFLGIIHQPTRIYSVREFASKGSLCDVLQDPNLKLDQLWIASFIEDLLKGMIYLHDSEVRVHGSLKSTNCVLSSRWTLQVADYGLHELRVNAETGTEHFTGDEEEDKGEFTSDPEIKYESLLWHAPELLRKGGVEKPVKGTQKGDIYSFGIILHETLSRRGPFEIFAAGSRSTLSAKEVIHEVMNGFEPYRPNIESLECQNYIIDLLNDAWAEIPERRPDFRHIRQRLKPLTTGIMKRNLMDHMMVMMEKYQNQLEDLVEERTQELAEEKKRTETLLHRMLPRDIASQLMTGQDVVPESYSSVTIYFSDIVGFTSISSESTPLQVVNFLNDLYTLFDRIIRRYDVYKVETIGDAYMVVSGLPNRNGDLHAGEIATMGLHLLAAVKSFRIPHRPDVQLKLRIGIHTGSCVAGVVGKTMPRYCLFGDTVNTASRMESNGEALKIHCSENTQQALSKLGGYWLDERGYVEMKGKGKMKTFWLYGKEEPFLNSPVHEDPVSSVLPFPFPRPGRQQSYLNSGASALRRPFGAAGSSLSVHRGEPSILKRFSNRKPVENPPHSSSAGPAEPESPTEGGPLLMPAHRDPSTLSEASRQRFLCPPGLNKNLSYAGAMTMTAAYADPKPFEPKIRPTQKFPIRQRPSSGHRNSDVFLAPNLPLRSPGHKNVLVTEAALRKRSMSVPDESAVANSVALQMMQQMDDDNIDDGWSSPGFAHGYAHEPLDSPPGGIELNNFPFHPKSPVERESGAMNSPASATLWEEDSQFQPSPDSETTTPMEPSRKTSKESSGPQILNGYLPNNHYSKTIDNSIPKRKRSLSTGDSDMYSTDLCPLDQIFGDSRNGSSGRLSPIHLKLDQVEEDQPLLLVNERSSPGRNYEKNKVRHEHRKSTISLQNYGSTNGKSVWHPEAVPKKGGAGSGGSLNRIWLKLKRKSADFGYDPRETIPDPAVV